MSSEQNLDQNSRKKYRSLSACPGPPKRRVEDNPPYHQRPPRPSAGRQVGRGVLTAPPADTAVLIEEAVDAIERFAGWSVSGLQPDAGFLHLSTLANYG